MKRIYITAVPLDSNFTVTLKPVKPVNFHLEGRVREAAFPIVPILAETAEEGDEVTVLAVRQKNSEKNENFEILRRELDALGIPGLRLRDLTIPQEQGKDILLALYAGMIEQTENDACYYACMTFGTKTYPLVLFSVLSFADKLRDNVSIKGIYYQEVLRENGAAQDARLYDVSTLFTLNSIVDTVAEMDGSNKVAMIRRLLEC